MRQGVADLGDKRGYDSRLEEMRKGGYSDTHPPLPMTNERKVKIESPPLCFSVSQMKPIVTAVVGHSQEQS